MKLNRKKFLVAGLLAGALTFVGCKSDSSAERTGTTDTTQTPATGTDTSGTNTGTGTDTSNTGTNPGTGGSGDADISTTKPSDDNLYMPEDDPLRTKQDDTVRQGESEQGVHDNTALPPESGTGGSGLDNNDAIDDNLNDGGNVDDLRIPDSPQDVRPDGLGSDSQSQIPEGAR
ncbi:hypothetical protein [Hyalangium versicolor]|uniref:hypothetical protein n=1 Tax=Hyalangium versicolor TaxID=2861190 RepID=UPI001CD00E8C|nr:hypothetical protein [Hyalangium versicolor]